jgi:hypothetical protein
MLRAERAMMSPTGWTVSGGLFALNGVRQVALAVA